MILAAGAASLMCSAAMAADMPIAPPPAYAPPPAEEFGGWYLRGDIGFSNQQVKNVRYDYAPYYPAGQVLNQANSFDTGGIYGVGVGYQFNNWIRADVTGQYRGNANYKGVDTFVNPGNVPGYDLYGASKSEWVVMANAYVDLGTWWCITPFVGAGVGASRVTIANFTDVGSGNGTVSSYATASTASKWNLAWAAHAGLAYKVSPNLTMELAYSYMSLGDGLASNLTAYTGFTRGLPFKFENITSHDVKLGVRWNIDSQPVYAPPLMRKG